MARDPRLDNLRVEPTERCWWCGAKANSQEHRFKHSSLRRVAGGTNPANVFKVSDNYAGTLISLSKGSQVRWPKNMCAQCNNARSQPFDNAYDAFERFAFTHSDEMGRWDWLDWSRIYGPDWQMGATNLARYFGKQIGCMLAGQDLPVPQDLITLFGRCRVLPDGMLHGLP